ncbi:MAG: aminotransferase class IV [Anaerosomatales bacterium]|nr:aminotransferase class IV [Anaerosomatales bacterium]
MNVRVEASPCGASDGWPAVALRETCRVALDGTVPLWPFHRRRLVAGGVGRAALDAVDEAVRDALAQLPERISSRTRLTVEISAQTGVAVAVQRRLSSLDAPSGVVGVPVVVDALPKLPPGAAKPADRAYWDDAQRAAAAAGGNQAILVSADGRVIDGGTAAIVVRRGREALTPPSPPAVASVALAWLLERAADFGVAIRAEPFALSELEAADEVVYLNAYGGARADRCGTDALAQAIQAELDCLWRVERG